MTDLKSRLVEALKGFALVQQHRDMFKRAEEMRALAAELAECEVVPGTPTPEMKRLGAIALHESYSALGGDAADSIYRAMLSAAREAK